MRTSRVARDTSRVTSALSRSKAIAEAASRSTRNARSRTSIAAFSASPSKPTSSVANEQLADEGDSSSLSSASDASSFEAVPAAEDNGVKRKRKVIVDTPVTTISEDGGDSLESRRRSSRGKPIKVEDKAAEIGESAIQKSRKIARTAKIKSARVTISETTRASPRKKSVKVEEDVEIEELGPAKPKKARRKPAKEAIDETSGEVVIHPPTDWEEVYQTTQEMRKLILAPVDTMGCERIAEQDRDPKVSFLLVVSWPYV